MGGVVGVGTSVELSAERNSPRLSRPQTARKQKPRGSDLGGVAESFSTPPVAEPFSMFYYNIENDSATVADLALPIAPREGGVPGALPSTVRPLLAGRIFRCWRVLANSERRGWVCD